MVAREQLPGCGSAGINADMTVWLRLGTQTHTAYPLWRWVWVPSPRKGRISAALATERDISPCRGKISPRGVQIGARVREKPLTLRSNVTKLSFKNGRH